MGYDSYRRPSSSLDGDDGTDGRLALSVLRAVILSLVGWHAARRILACPCSVWTAGLCFVDDWGDPTCRVGILECLGASKGRGRMHGRGILCNGQPLSARTFCDGGSDSGVGFQCGRHLACCGDFKWTDSVSALVCGIVALWCADDHDGFGCLPARPVCRVCDCTIWNMVHARSLSCKHSVAVASRLCQLTNEPYKDGSSYEFVGLPELQFLYLDRIHRIDWIYCFLCFRLPAIASLPGEADGDETEIRQSRFQRERKAKEADCITAEKLPQRGILDFCLSSHRGVGS